MATRYSPSIVTSGLILTLDAGNIKSCGGQPTINLLTNTNNFSASNWVGYCGPTSNVTYNTTDVVDPVGTNTAVKVVRNNQNGCFAVGDVSMGLIYISSSNILTAGKTYTTSFYARGLNGGEGINYGLNDSHNIGVTLTTTWTRYSYTFSNISGVDRGFQFVNYNTNQTYYVWGPQTQEGSYVGPYAPSTPIRGTANLTWNDLTGNNNGIPTNYPGFLSTEGGSMLFDGSSNYVAVANSSTLQVADTFTVCAWIKASNLSARYGIFSTRTNNTTGCWQFEVGTGSGGTGRILMTGINTYIAESINDVISANRWFYICVVKVNNATQGATLYVNGVAVSNIQTTAYTILNNSDEKRIAIGTGAGQYFPGQITMVNLYNRALSSDEILQNYNATRNRFKV